MLADISTTDVYVAVPAGVVVAVCGVIGIWLRQRKKEEKK